MDNVCTSTRQSFTDMDDRGNMHVPNPIAAPSTQPPEDSTLGATYGLDDSTTNFLFEVHRSRHVQRCINLMYANRPSDEDDEDLDEQDIPGFTAPGLHSPVIDKGKSRAPDPVGQTNGAGAPAQGISGNINSSNVPHKPARQTVGGVRVETRYVSFVWSGHSTENQLGYRYTGVDTLDEPVTTTIVRVNP